MTRPASGPGRLLERIGDDAPRGMTVHDRTRLTGRLRHLLKTRLISPAVQGRSACVADLCAGMGRSEEATRRDPASVRPHPNPPPHGGGGSRHLPPHQPSPHGWGSRRLRPHPSPPPRGGGGSRHLPPPQPSPAWRGREQASAPTPSLSAWRGGRPLRPTPALPRIAEEGAGRPPRSFPHGAACFSHLRVAGMESRAVRPDHLPCMRGRSRAQRAGGGGAFVAGGARTRHFCASTRRTWPLGLHLLHCNMTIP